MFTKILIANRGEIACRIIKTAQRLGIHCVAIYSDADQHAQHTKLADTSLRIGPSPSSKSYLNIDAIIAAAQQTGAEAIHPGYGFLSENPHFAERCETAGITFIGPPATAIAVMGSKSAAKKLMTLANVPVLPGYHGNDQSLNTFKQAAEQIGYPILLKPVAGGGGKGMHIIQHPEQLQTTLVQAQREARSSFGDEEILIEKYLDHPRHIEVQIFMDTHGNGIHLHERDCSVQRRHQKIIEEAPAHNLTTSQRQQLGDIALQAARTVSYVGAGTIEFLMDEHNQFYFMEMNTRLQVEHPVTEMITGIDLVEWQLRIACREPLPLQQSQIPLNGHAIEVRIYAEDPEQNFMPDSGELQHLQFPAETLNTRIDSGVREHDTISPWYDPMIAKLIVHHTDRKHTIQSLRHALHACQIAGIKTNIDFLKALTATPDYQQGNIHVAWLDQQIKPLTTPIDRNEYRACAALCILLKRQQQPADATPWLRLDSWALNTPPQHRVQLYENSQRHNLIIEPCASSPQTYKIQQHDNTQTLQAYLDDTTLHIQTHTHKKHFHYYQPTDKLILYGHDGSACYTLNTPISIQTPRTAGSNRNLRAPINGTISVISIKPGDNITAGTIVIIMEAMKMEHALRSPQDGRVASIHCKPGDLIQAGTELLRFSDPTST